MHVLCPNSRVLTGTIGRNTQRKTRSKSFFLGNEDLTDNIVRKVKSVHEFYEYSIYCTAVKSGFHLFMQSKYASKKVIEIWEKSVFPHYMLPVMFVGC